ncbi:MAG TPA: branched-chain amino acid ABC transporter permease [Desulfatiglandales bacterium]|nr:branched-chain amino acid ABC transporter permease [Desulfatiglandales bacterium]
MRKLKFHPCGNFNETYEQEITIFETDFGRLSMLAGIIFLFAVVPFISNAYTLYILNTIGIYAIAAVGLNLLIGYTGQISLGHGAFFGVGAYTAAILATKMNIPFLVTIPAAGFITALVGMVFGIPSIRLKHLYLTIATLAGQFILEYIFVQWESLTGGAEGVSIPTANIFGIGLNSDRVFFFVIFFCLIVMSWMAVNIIRTRYGRAFIAIRDNDQAAEGMGIPIFRYKLLSFAISSFYAGIAGGLFAYYMMSITPEPFNLWLSIQYIAIIIIGGLGSIPGAIFGSIFIITLNEILSSTAEYFMNLEASIGIGITIAPLREFIYGLTIILFIIFEPKGLAEVWRIVRSNFRLWPFSY